MTSGGSVHGSLRVRLGFVLVFNTVLAVALHAALAWWVPHVFLPSWVALASAILIMIPISLFSAARALSPIRKALRALDSGVRSLHDRDFSMRLGATTDDSIDGLLRLYNQVADVLRSERSELYQKELLLDTILQGAPMAIVLTNSLDRIVYSNRFARELYHGAKAIDGENFRELLERVEHPLRESIFTAPDSLVTMQDDTFHVSRRDYYLNTQRHTVHIVKRLTPELRRQEIAVWKKAIRLMNHELNNSLAPVSSLMHTARKVRDNPEHAHRRDEIFDTIQERLEYLSRFLQGYAEFARLPLPRIEPATWGEVVSPLQGIVAFSVDGALPARDVRLDRAQIGQALINLLRNAHEAGSPPDEVRLTVEQRSGAFHIQVLDRGRGMTSDEMENALLPFFSSKAAGTGLGLPLCNEIVEAHGGTLRLQRRDGGGMAVAFTLPF